MSRAPGHTGLLHETRMLRRTHGGEEKQLYTTSLCGNLHLDWRLSLFASEGNRIKVQKVLLLLSKYYYCPTKH